MNFHIENMIEQNGKKFGTVKEGNVDESGKITYTKCDEFADRLKRIPTHELSSDEIIERATEEFIKTIFGIELDKKQLTEEAWDKARKLHGITKEPENKKDLENTCKETKKETPSQTSQNEPVKIGVDVAKLDDDEFIEFTRRRASMNKQHERFKAIKTKLRKILEGNTYNDRMFNIFIKLRDIEKRGFFNRTQEDDSLIDEAVMLYGAM